MPEQNKSMQQTPTLYVNKAGIEIDPTKYTTERGDAMDAWARSQGFSPKQQDATPGSSVTANVPNPAESPTATPGQVEEPPAPVVGQATETTVTTGEAPARGGARSQGYYHPARHDAWGDDVAAGEGPISHQEEGTAREHLLPVGGPRRGRAHLRRCDVRRTE